MFCNKGSCRNGGGALGFAKKEKFTKFVKYSK